MIARQVLVMMEIHLLNRVTVLGTGGISWSNFPAITGSRMEQVSLMRTPAMSNLASTVTIIQNLRFDYVSMLSYDLKQKVKLVEKYVIGRGHKF